jgi:hypothetical protein
MFRGISAFFLTFIILLPSVVWARLGSHDRKLKPARQVKKKIPGQYIVMMNDNVSNVQGAINGILHANDNAAIHHLFERVFKGVLLANVPDALLQRLLASSSIKEVYEVSPAILLS